MMIKADSWIFPGNPCIVEVILNYGSVQYSLAFGEIGQHYSRGKIDGRISELEKKAEDGDLSYSMSQVKAIQRLWQEGKIKNPDDMVYLSNMEISYSPMQRQGFGTAALHEAIHKTMVMRRTYVAGAPATPAGQSFMCKQGFEEICRGLWLKKAHCECPG